MIRFLLGLALRKHFLSKLRDGSEKIGTVWEDFIDSFVTSEG
jgi:hypothetical protein